jgi:hypothetical protein
LLRISGFGLLSAFGLRVSAFHGAGLPNVYAPDADGCGKELKEQESYHLYKHLSLHDLRLI